MKSEDIHNTTFLLESEGGQSRLDLRDGMTHAQCGQEVVHANPSALRESSKRKKTNVTSDHTGTGSSASIDLQRSLESKLQERLPLDGWTKSRQTWKQKVTPSGRQYSQLVVSVRPTKETAYGLWHSPRVTMIQESPENFQRRMNSKRANDRSEHATPNLAVQALWATPNTMDNLPPRSKESLEAMHDRARKGRSAPSNLREQVIPSIWPTPCARDWKDTGNLDTSMQRKDGKMRHDSLPRAAWLGSTAQTASKGQLNPAFPCWLMGYPENYEKLLYRAMETPSSHK